MGESGPIVSIGVPVRNGGDSLARALEGLVTQSYANLDIVISDNASTDGTERVCRRFAEADARVRYVRQPRLLPVLDNYRFVFEQTRSDLFMWAAHGEFRSPNNIEVLVSAFGARRDAAL